MKDGLQYDPQVEDQQDSGDPKDPLGILKPRTGNNDPLGILKPVQVNIPKVEFSQPDYKTFQPATGVRQFYLTPGQKQADIPKSDADKFLDQQKLQNEGETAHQNLTNTLRGSNDVVEGLLGVEKMKKAQQIKAAADQGVPGAMEQYQKELANIPLPGDNPQFTEQKKQELLADPLATRQFAAAAVAFHPAKAKEIKQDLYKHDAAQRGADYETVQKNLTGIQKGDLDYNIKTGQVEKQVNPLESFINGWKYKNKLFDDYDFIKSASDQELADKYEKRRNEYNPDEPLQKPSGTLGEITQMFASQPTKAMITEGVLAAIPGAEEAAPVAGAAVGAYDYGRMGQASSFEQLYNEARNQGKSSLEAAQLAKIESQKAGDIDALQGAAMTGMAGKFGMKGLPNFSKNFEKAAADFLKTTGKEGTVMAALGAGGQFAKNKLAQAAGIDRPSSEGMLDQIKSNFLMTVGIKAAIQGGKFVEPIIHGLSKADPQILDNYIEQNVQEGEITPEQGNSLKMTIDDHKGMDAAIPGDIDELSRLKIKAMIRQRDMLKAKLETTDEFAHPAIKEEIKGLNEEMLKLAQNKVKPEEEVPQNVPRSTISDEGQNKVDNQNIENGITQEAQDLLESVKQGSKPAFISKKLEKIAADNNIEITGKSTPDDIINALKSKQNAETIRSNTGQTGSGGQALSGSQDLSSENIQQPQGQEPITAGVEQQAGQPIQESTGTNKEEDVNALPFTGRTGELVGISHGSAEKRAGETPVLPPERGEGVSAEEAIQHGRDLLDKGADAQKAADAFKKTGDISYDGLSVVRAKHAELAKATNKAIDEFGENSKQAKAASDAESKWYKDYVKPMQTEWHKIGQVQQGETDIDTGTFVGLRRAFQQETGKEPSPQQVKEAKTLSGKVAGLTKEVETLKQKLTDALDNATKQEGKAPKSIKERANEIADLIRKGKTNRPGSFQAATPASLVWDSALEVMAKTVEAGGTAIQALSDGLSHIKQSEWFKGLSEDKQRQAEDDFNTHFKNEDDLFTRFADKKDNKFSPKDARDIWDYAKTEYLNKGKDFGQMIAGTAKDLGLTNEQVRDALVTPKGARELTTEMYAKQNHQRQAIQQAKAWVKEANTPPWKKFLKKIPNFFFNVKTFGHGTVGAITHAGMNIFRPSAWSAYWPAAIKQFEYSFGGLSKKGLANYEMAMEDLKNDPQFPIWKRAGLAVDPTERYDDYQTFAKGNSFSARLLKMGDRGFNALKGMRLEMAKKDFENLSNVEKADPEVLKTIATLVNHSTGTSHIPVPEAIGTAFFAPRLEASRWARLITDPGKAIATVANWKNASLAEKAQAKIVGKKAAEVMVGYLAALAANQGILMATGSKQSINLLDPTSSDWLKFKIAGRTVDASGGIISSLGFITGMAHIATESKGELKGKKRGDEFVSKGGKYLRGKLSPFGSTIADFATQHDYAGNTMPFSSDKPINKFAHQLSWKEYAFNQQTPIPVAEYFKDTEEQMKSKGMSEKDINTIMQGIFVAAMTGGTGVHINEDYKMKK